MPSRILGRKGVVLAREPKKRKKLLRKETEPRQRGWREREKAQKES